ncbi:glutathione S-transferase family protein [Pseudoroseomonas ludipueritiae]|uniref:Glutathione S-transferase family protein n=1 Tax=Pseudoroseomonas ludipueritiae TaxID=198093 RepID=A0ABR7R6W5_9PROT|nr:glutathione S-transferase family protein [Pseudoroseomonas ludipueritiae]MBC9177456.1 glutathione S-transferase family protein [Pseudoroseomonas ludipueritiae]
MKLHWCPRTRSLRALWMLEEAGAAYERVLVDIHAGGQQDPAFLALNPMAKVPVLEQGAIVIADSTAICAWLADRMPEAGLAPPLNHTDRGRYLQWLIFPSAYMEPAMVERHGGWKGNPQAYGWGDFDRVMSTLDAGLAQGPWLLGQQFSAADVVLGSALRWGLMFDLIPSTPLRADYVRRCEARPALQRALAIDAGPEEALAGAGAGPKPPQD